MGKSKKLSKKKKKKIRMAKEDKTLIFTPSPASYPRPSPVEDMLRELDAAEAAAEAAANELIAAEAAGSENTGKSNSYKRRQRRKKKKEAEAAAAAEEAKAAAAAAAEEAKAAAAAEEAKAAAAAKEAEAAAAAKEAKAAAAAKEAEAAAAAAEEAAYHPLLPRPSSPRDSEIGSENTGKSKSYKKKKEAPAEEEAVAAEEAAYHPLLPCPSPRDSEIGSENTGKSKSYKKRQRIKKKKEAAAAAEEAAAEEEEAAAEEANSNYSVEKSLAADYEYRKSLQHCYSHGLESYIYPKLCPHFPKQRESLSLDCGFAQTPTLKKILAHYGDYIPSAQDIVSESLRPDSKVRLKLRDIYSRTASSVVAVSSFFGVERKVDCSGFIVDWRSDENEGTILTSAKVLCNPANSGYEFHLIVRMADGTLFLAKEDHVDFYNNILTLKVKSKAELNALDLTAADIVGRDRVTGLVERVVALGRSFCEYSFLDYVGELDQEYPRFGCDELLRSSCYASQICEGGPLITDEGHVVGINFFGNGDCAHVLPTRIILSCLERWRSLGTVMRPYFGFTVVDVKQAHFQMCERLNLSHRESHVLVKEVFEGSLAYKNKVHPHDLISSLNGTRIQSAQQYSELLSQAVTDCADSSQSFVVCIDTFGHSEEVSFVAENLSVDDMRFCDCWPQVEGREWSRKKFGSQKNPRFCWPPSPEEDTC